jgi:hypothetical protein
MSSSHDAWVDLASRESDDIEVALLWSRAFDCVEVVVADTKLDGGFELDVPGRGCGSRRSAIRSRTRIAAHLRTGSPIDSDLRLQG